MAENEPEKESREEITPRRGMIELMQAVSVLLIPVAAWLLLSDRPWWASTAVLVALALFLIPFHLIKLEVNEAEKTKPVDKAKKADAALRGLGQGVPIAPYHSRHEDAEVYHIFADCNFGEDIEPENWTQGDGGKTLCKVCEEMTRGREKQKPAA